MSKLFVAILLLSLSVLGKTQVMYQFLNLPVNGNTAALGGILPAGYSTQIGSEHDNPAKAAYFESDRLMLAFSDYYAGTNFGYISANRNTQKWGTLAIGLQFMNYGSFTEADPYGSKTGRTFRAGDYALSMYNAHKLNDLWSIGAELSTVWSQYEQYTAVGSELSAGLYYRNPEKLLSFGLVAENMGFQWKSLAGNRESFPFDIKLGVSKKPLHAPFRLNLSVHSLTRIDLGYNSPLTTDQSYFISDPTATEKKSYADLVARHLSGGVEFVPSDKFSVLLGYNHKRRRELSFSEKQAITGFSLGFQVKFKRFRLQYGRAAYHLAGSTNQFSVITGIGSPSIKKQSKNKTAE